MLLERVVESRKLALALKSINCDVNRAVLKTYTRFRQFILKIFKVLLNLGDPLSLTEKLWFRD